MLLKELKTFIKFLFLYFRRKGNEAIAVIVIRS